MRQGSSACGGASTKKKGRQTVVLAGKPSRSVIALPCRHRPELSYDRLPAGQEAQTYRDAVCGLCERVVSFALEVPLSNLQARTRSTADVALARQIAMYLCHTTFSLLLTEVGLHFQRDRTTVSHACALIEDKRDDLAFDVMICQLEALLYEARVAMCECFELGGMPLTQGDRHA